MISRRGLFRLLGGLAASPVLKPLTGLFPVNGIHSGKLSPWFGGIWKQRSAARSLEVYYSKNLINTLRAQTVLTEGETRPLPINTGKTIQFFTYAPESPC